MLKLNAPVVPSELGISTLERGVSVGLGLLDAVPMGCISSKIPSVSNSPIPPHKFYRKRGREFTLIGLVVLRRVL